MNNAEMPVNETHTNEMPVREMQTNENAAMLTNVNNQGSSILKRYGKYIALVVVLLVFAVTTPNKQDHVKAVRSSVLEAVSKSDSLSKDTEAAMLLGAGLIDKILESKLHVDNYIIFSCGKIDTGKEDKLVSIGVLTHVFVGDIDEKKLKDVMK